MFRCDGFECHVDPVDSLRFRSKNRITEFRCFREVERGRLQPDWVTESSYRCGQGTNAHTIEGVFDIKEFEGMRTSSH